MTMRGTSRGIRHQSSLLLLLLLLMLMLLSVIEMVTESVRWKLLRLTGRVDWRSIVLWFQLVGRRDDTGESERRE